MSAKRNIAAIPLADFQPAPVPTAKPEITWIDPRDLLVDETYQRNLSERSLALIKRIATGWDWRKFKAPNCAWTDDGLEIIDGQHTAIGAACRDDIPLIPVLVAEAAEQSDRAAAFIGLNRDRVAITVPQIHAAAVTAGDADALAIEAAATRAGLTVLKTQPGAGRFKPRETMAIAAIGALVKKDEVAADEVLQILSEANLAPVQATHIKAVDLLFRDDQFAQLDRTALARVISTLGADAVEREGKVFAATHKLPLWKAIAAVWFQKAPKQRKAATPADRSLLGDVKRDDRPPKSGWQSGRYMRRCTVCDCRFEGAIKSTKCADCAYLEV